MSNQLVEALIVIACIALLGSYHLVMLRRLRTHPSTTLMGRHRQVRALWVRMRGGRDRELEVVQAMRNLIMAASLLASTAVLVAGALLGAVFSGAAPSGFVTSLNSLGVDSPIVWEVKALLLAAVYFGVFVSFTLAIRSFSYVGLMVPSDEIGPEEVDEEMERGALGFSLGIRGFYISLPLILWLLGPLWMLAGTVLLVVFLRQID
jgi:uncharacterized membrane protein